MVNIYSYLEIYDLDSESENSCIDESESYDSDTYNVKSKPNLKPKPLALPILMSKPMPILMSNPIPKPIQYKNTNNHFTNTFAKNTKSNNNKFSNKKKSNSLRLPLNEHGVYDEFTGLPSSIQEAFKTKHDLTLKQITMIMGLNGLIGEMFNVIHDRLQQQISRHSIKITHQGRVFYVSIYNWRDLVIIEKIIVSMFTDY